MTSRCENLSSKNLELVLPRTSVARLGFVTSAEVTSQSQCQKTFETSLRGRLDPSKKHVDLVPVVAAHTL